MCERKKVKKETKITCILLVYSHTLMSIRPLTRVATEHVDSGYNPQNKARTLRDKVRSREKRRQYGYYSISERDFFCCCSCLHLPTHKSSQLPAQRLMGLSWYHGYRPSVDLRSAKKKKLMVANKMLCHFSLSPHTPYLVLLSPQTDTREIKPACHDEPRPRCALDNNR